MKLRVAMVSEHANPLARLGTADAGGQNVYVDALARHLAGEGVLVDVYTRRDDPHTPDVVAAGPGVSVHHVPAGPASPIAKDELFPHMPEFADNLARAWRWHRPDAVHAHFWMSGWAARAARPRAAPLIQTFHALGAVKRRHQGAADTSPVDRDDVERSLAADADVVIATCRDEIDELIALGGSLDRMAVVPCGVDREFHPFGASESLPRDRPHRIACVSRLVPRKGVDDVIRALALLPDDVELIVAGGPPADRLDADPEISRLKAIAAKVGVDDRCRFVGSVGRGDVATLLRSSDVAACTPWYEPFGMVAVEAMACGVPVVGTDVGGLRDTIQDGVTGIRVRPRCPEDIAAAIGQLLDDPVQRRAFGVAAARRADLLYRWPTVARAVLDVYRRALSYGSVDSGVVTA